MRKKIYIIGIMLFVVMYIFSTIKSGDRVFAKTKLSIADREKSDKKVKVILTGENIDSVYIDDLLYEKNGDLKTINSKSISIKENIDSWIFTYTCKEKKYGSYYLFINVVYSDGSNVTLEQDFEYKSKSDSVKDEVKIASPPRVVNIPEIGEFTSYYDIDHSGKEIYLQPQQTVTVKILYRTTKKIINEYNAKLHWGNKVINSDKIKYETQKDGEFWNCGAVFHITTSGDMSGELVAYYEEGSKKVSRSLGVNLISDGTAPNVSMGKKYVRGTVYFKDDVSVPITVKEENFDSNNIFVNVDGSNLKVSWSDARDVHTTHIKLGEGSHQIEIKGTDKAGNKLKTHKSAVIVVDTKEPEVDIKGFENRTGKGLDNNGKVVPLPVTVTISDNVGIKKYDVNLVKIENDGQPTEINMDKEQNGNVITYYVADLPDDGYYTLQVGVSDMAGNFPVRKTVTSEGETEYEISKGVISGEFTVNRNGSKYIFENEEIFNSPQKDISDIVIYEYNKNEVTECSVYVVDNYVVDNGAADNSGRRKLNLNSDYWFEQLDDADTEYKYKYKYTISGYVFAEGNNSIQIESKSIAGDSASLVRRIEESNNINKTLVVDKTPPEVIVFRTYDKGKLEIKIRDNNMDENSVKIEGDNVKCNDLAKDEERSTSTNVVYTGHIKGNLENATITCSDFAGNTCKTSGIVIEKSDSITPLILVISLCVLAVVLIVTAIIIILNVKKRK